MYPPGLGIHVKDKQFGQSYLKLTPLTCTYSTDIVHVRHKIYNKDQPRVQGRLPRRNHSKNN